MLTAVSVPARLLRGSSQAIGIKFVTHRRSNQMNRAGAVAGHGSYVTVDRQSNPLVNNDLIPAPRKNEYNGAATDAHINAILDVVQRQGDILRLDLRVPNFGPQGGNNSNGGFGHRGGRRLLDDVVDATFTLINNGVLLTDFMNANEVPFRNVFPFVADPTQPFPPASSRTIMRDNNWVGASAGGCPLPPARSSCLEHLPKEVFDYCRRCFLFPRAAGTCPSFRAERSGGVEEPRSEIEGVAAGSLDFARDDGNSSRAITTSIPTAAAHVSRSSSDGMNNAAGLAFYLLLGMATLRCAFGQDAVGTPVAETERITVVGREDDLIGYATTSSEGVVGAVELQARPLLRRGGIA